MPARDAENLAVETDAGAVRVRLYWHPRGASWYYRFWMRGKQHHAATGADILSKARVAAIQAVRKAERAAGDGSPLTVAGAIDLSLLARWPKSETLDRSYTGAKNRLKQFERYADGDTDLSSLSLDETIDLVQAYLRHRQKAGVAATTIRNDQLALSGFFAWLIREQRARIGYRVNPASRKLLTLPRHVQRAQPPLSSAVQLAVLKAARGHETWPAVVLALGAGLRGIEIARLRWHDVDGDLKLARVGAKNKERLVPLPGRVLAELAALKKAGWPKPWRMGSHSMHDELSSLRASRGLPDAVTMQALRRSAAFRLSRELSPLDYARVLGHTLNVAQRHYLAFGSYGAAAAGNVLAPADWPETEPADSPADKIPARRRKANAHNELRG